MVFVAESLPSSSHVATYLAQIDSTHLLKPQEERELAYRIGAEDAEARDHLVRANLRLVVRIAREYQNRGLSLDDLVQEGNLGLMRAVEGFDPEVGTRFSTYAVFWIRQSIQQSLDKMSLPIRVPSYAVDLVMNWRRTTARLTDGLGRAPSAEEVASTLRLSKKQVAIVEKALRVYNGTPSPRGDATWPTEETLPDRALPPGSALSAAEEMQQVLQLLDTIPEREATILRLRFGLTGQEPMTLKQVGQQLDLTRERVRQLEREALQKLKEKL